MPAGKGKQSITIVIPERVKEDLDTEASTRGIDRSALILEKLQAVDGPGPWDRVAMRLDHQDRQLMDMQASLAQLVTALHELVASLRKAPAAEAKPVYPTPATWQETYPELYAPKVAPPEPVVVAPTPPEKKGWPWRR